MKKDILEKLSLPVKVRHSNLIKDFSFVNVRLVLGEEKKIKKMYLGLHNFGRDLGQLSSTSISDKRLVT